MGCPDPTERLMEKGRRTDGPIEGDDRINENERSCCGWVSEEGISGCLSQPVPQFVSNIALLRMFGSERWGGGKVKFEMCNLM